MTLRTGDMQSVANINKTLAPFDKVGFKPGNAACEFMRRK